MELICRPAVDSEIDAPFFAWGLNEAMGGGLDLMLGSRCREIIAVASRIPGHDFSLEHVTIAKAGKQAVGIFSGMPTEAMASVAPVLRRCAGVLIVRAALFYLAGWPVLRGMSRHAPGEWYLQAIVVTPSTRGSGAGTRLMALAEDKAQMCGCTRIALDVVATNTGGIRLYERLGYARERTPPRAWLLGGVHVHRMSKAVEMGSRNLVSKGL